MGKGIETDEVANVANIAGYWTLGVGKGILVAGIPIVMVAIAYGFMLRVTKLGERLGRR
jgi:hypothetical protein